MIKLCKLLSARWPVIFLTCSFRWKLFGHCWQPFLFNIGVIELIRMNCCTYSPSNPKTWCKGRTRWIRAAKLPRFQPFCCFDALKVAILGPFILTAKQISAVAFILIISIHADHLILVGVYLRTGILFAEKKKDFIDVKEESAMRTKNKQTNK